jgi:hypothetical protein
VFWAVRFLFSKLSFCVLSLRPNLPCLKCPSSAAALTNPSCRFGYCNLSAPPSPPVFFPSRHRTSLQWHSVFDKPLSRNYCDAFSGSRPRNPGVQIRGSDSFRAIHVINHAATDNPVADCQRGCDPRRRRYIFINTQRPREEKLMAREKGCAGRRKIVFGATARLIRNNQRDVIFRKRHYFLFLAHSLYGLKAPSV